MKVLEASCRLDVMFIHVFQGAVSSGRKNEAIQSSYEAIVKYCEEPRCRHAAIASYFGDSTPKCTQGCDYCKDPDAVDELVEHWRRGVTAGHNRSVTAGRTYIAHSLSSGEDDELYGGGKWGYERKVYEDDYDDEDDREGGSGEERAFRCKLIADEFKKRRKGKQSLTCPPAPQLPGPNCRLKEAANYLHIPKLAIKVREHCFGLLEEALKSNINQCAKTEETARLLFDMESTSIDIEHSIFTSSKTDIGYKTAMLKKVGEVKSSTSSGSVFVWKRASQNSTATSTTASVSRDALQDIDQETEEANTKEFTPFVSALQLVKSNHRITKEPAAANPPLKIPIPRVIPTIKYFFENNDKSEVKEELQADDGEKIPANSQKRTASEDFWWLDDVPLHKKSRLKDHPTSDACTNSNVGSDVKDAVIPNEIFGFRKASDLKPLKQLKNNLDRRTTVKLKPIKSVSLDNYSQKDGQSSIKCAPLKLNTQTVSKDVHDRKKSGERSSLGDHDNASPGDPVGVKDVANVVVKYLSPYLKQGSIVSKDLFKFLARCITHRVMGTGKASSPSSRKVEVKATVKKLFEVCRKFEQETDWDKYIRAVESGKTK